MYDNILSEQIFFYLYKVVHRGIIPTPYLQKEEIYTNPKHALFKLI